MTYEQGTEIIFMLGFICGVLIIGIAVGRK